MIIITIKNKEMELSAAELAAAARSSTNELKKKTVDSNEMDARNKPLIILICSNKN